VINLQIEQFEASSLTKNPLLSSRKLLQQWRMRNNAVDLTYLSCARCDVDRYDSNV